MQLEIRPDPAEVGRARRWARSRLAGSGIGADEPLAETLILLVSELVTNAVVHTGCPAVLRLSLPGADAAEEVTVRLEVADRSGRAPVPRCAGDEATGGRGLALVDGLADRWGWSTEGSRQAHLVRTRPLRRGVRRRPRLLRRRRGDVRRTGLRGGLSPRPDRCRSRGEARVHGGTAVRCRT